MICAVLVSALLLGLVVDSLAQNYKDNLFRSDFDAEKFSFEIALASDDLSTSRSKLLKKLEDCVDKQLKKTDKGSKKVSIEADEKNTKFKKEEVTLTKYFGAEAGQTFPVFRAPNDDNSFATATLRFKQVYQNKNKLKKNEGELALIFEDCCGKGKSDVAEVKFANKYKKNSYDYDTIDEVELNYDVNSVPTTTGSRRYELGKKIEDNKFDDAQLTLGSFEPTFFKDASEALGVSVDTVLQTQQTYDLRYVDEQQLTVRDGSRALFVDLELHLHFPTKSAANSNNGTPVRGYVGFDLDVKLLKSSNIDREDAARIGQDLAELIAEKCV